MTNLWQFTHSRYDTFSFPLVITFKPPNTTFKILMIFLDKFSELMDLVFGLLKCCKLLQYVRFPDPPLKILWQFFSKCLIFLFSRGVCHKQIHTFWGLHDWKCARIKMGTMRQFSNKGYLQVHISVNCSTFQLRNALKSVRAYSCPVRLDAKGHSVWSAHLWIMISILNVKADASQGHGLD